MPNHTMPRDELLLDRRFDRREFLAMLGSAAAAMLTRRSYALEAGPRARRPNIVVIVADDLGYADIGVHGCKDIPTPSIDSIAQNGVRFTNGYVSCPVCSPTRAGLMTGRYQQRFGHEFNPGPANKPGIEVGLPLTEVTFADLLKAAGYATGHAGKWHLGAATGSTSPSGRGFDEAFIGPGQAAAGEDPKGTRALTNEAVSFIERHKSRPFFLYLAYYAVHSPLLASQAYLERFKHIADERRRTYAAMLSAMDDGIGAVLSKLKDAGLFENTMLFFLSDNGGPSRPVGGNASSNLPLRATKATVYEGGIRVPFLLQWPRRIPRGKIYHHPVISLDILPSAVAAAGGRLPRDRVIDGVDLLPHIIGRKKAPPHDALFWRFGAQHAMRKGNWKLVKLAGQRPELYDLSRDMSESRDLAARKPEIVRALSDSLAAWESELSAPLWQPGTGRRRAANRAAPGRPARQRQGATQ